MQRFLIVGAVALVAGSMGVTRVATLEGDLQRLEEFSRTNPRRTLALETEVQTLEAELQLALDRVSVLNDSQDSSKRLLRTRITALETSLVKAAQKLESHGMALYSLEKAPGLVEDRLQSLEAGVESRLAESTSATEALLAQARAEVSSSSDDDVEARWRRIVAPTVQLAGQTTVGSGVVLESRELESGAGYETLLITSWHVVRDILADAGSDMAPVPVSIFGVDGVDRELTASLLCHEVEMDAALLRLNTSDKIKHGARLATRDEMESRRVFHSVYAVGCPLGNDPIPTSGQIADLTHVVEGTSYWMISAPTYIGNSGGGIYGGESERLMGVFSKIYTHGSVRPTVVPHMGLVTPLVPFFDWLEEGGHARVEETATGAVIYPTAD